VDEPHVYFGARSGFFEMPDSVEWQTAYETQMEKAQRAPQAQPEAVPAK
jgi:hypothetical protein